MDLRQAVAQLEQTGNYTYIASIVRQCGELRDRKAGKKVHQSIDRSNYQGHTLLGNLLIQMYGKCGDVHSCRLAFSRIRSPNVFTWTIMLEAYAHNGYLQHAVELFEEMPEKNVVSWTTMITAFSNLGCVDEAKRIFEKMPQKTVAAINAMLTAYAGKGHFFEAMCLYRNMNLEGMKANFITFILVLSVCTRVSHVRVLHATLVSAGYKCETKVCNALINAYGCLSTPEEARRTFDELSSKSIVSWNIMISIYSRTQYIEEAREMFDKMPERNVVSWNTMISAYTQRGKDAIQVFQRMCLLGIRPNRITFVHVLECFPSSHHLRKLHGLVLEVGYGSDAYICTAFVSAYGKCGNILDARKTVDEMSHPDVVAWTALINVYAQHGLGKQGLDAFKSMLVEGTTPNEVTFLSVLDACSSIGDISHGTMIHKALLDTGLLDQHVSLLNAVISMYGRCGSLQDAWDMFYLAIGFDSLNTVTWNSMVAVLSRSGKGTEAFGMLKKMHLEGVKPEGITVVSVLGACSLSDGKAVHSSIIGTGIGSETRVVNALVSMYSEGGCLEEAKRIFDSMPVKNCISWSALIAAHAKCGEILKALELFQVMNLEGQFPDEITFVSLLSACSHAGLSKDGLELFLSMEHDYLVEHNVDHLMCLADLLGRVGKLAEAEDILDLIPLESSMVAWTSLLGCCKTANDHVRAESVSSKLCEMKSLRSGPYVLVSNVTSSNPT